MAGDPPTTPTGIPLHVPDARLLAFLDEDLGSPWRDATSDPLFDPETPGRARVVARAALVASGIDEAVRLFTLCGAHAAARAADGDAVAAGAVLLDVSGPTRAILRAERTALNLLARMSGIATLTRSVQDRVAAVAPGCRVAATRKTTPGFRVFEKRAVAHGGGDPHRFGLYDQVLLKDNHRAAVPDLAAAIATLRRADPTLAIEVEVEDLDSATVAAAADVDLILIDNRDPDTCGQMARHIRALAPRTRIEASGGITPETAVAYAPHVDRISLGALTMRAPAADLSLEWGT